MLHRGFDYFSLEVHSPEPIEYKTLEKHIPDKSAAESLLTSAGIPEDRLPAIEEDLKRRREFEIQRAIDKQRKGKAHPLEIAMLKKRQVI